MAGSTRFRDLGPAWWTRLGRLAVQSEAAALAMYRQPVANPRPHLLAIDDEPLLTSVYERLANVSGFLITWTRSSKEAIRLAARDPFDVIVTDCGRPDLSGVDTLMRIRESGPNASTPAIMISAGNIFHEVDGESVPYTEDEFRPLLQLLAPKPFSREGVTRAWRFLSGQEFNLAMAIGIVGGWLD